MSVDKCNWYLISPGTYTAIIDNFFKNRDAIVEERVAIKKKVKAYGYVVRDDYVVAWAFKKQPDLSKWKVAPKRSQVGDSAIAYVPTKKNELYDNLKKVMSIRLPDGGDFQKSLGFSDWIFEVDMGQQIVRWFHARIVNDKYFVGVPKSFKKKLPKDFKPIKTSEYLKEIGE